MPTAPSAPYLISGTVTLNSSNYAGAKIWLRNLTSGSYKAPRDDISYVYTNSSGKYLINATDALTSVNASDKIRVFCKVADEISQSDHTVEIKKGGATVNFTITSRGVGDGLKPGLSSGRGGLYKGLLKGTKDAMQ
jgi:hypothetical protein